MPSESKPLLTAQTEKPNHYSYLKEFRVEQCPLFLQHKCTQHRPFTCFNWHFMNQRRRRPVRKRDGSFNYSADNYCTKYDETTGLCPEGDECPYLHRTAGDTERRYHLRYYKTCMCVHDTDTRGLCAKNGQHCAFAHGNHDLRPPVYDIKEIQAIENAEGEGNASNGPNVLDKERNLMNEDPKWQDTNYVLSSYKTEPCKRPPRLCRQGYACPQYHNSRDKRRSPRKFKYRSTPCPNVKHGDEWGEPGNCDSGDACGYCHTRTEQQFHPEIYKSTKCNDVQQAGYCPRGVFCAFAHVDQEMSIARELAAPLDAGTNLVDILSSALPTGQNQQKRDRKSSESSNGDGSECGSSDSSGCNSPHNKAPGAHLSHTRMENHVNNQQSSYSNQLQNESIQIDIIKKQIMAVENDTLLDPLEKAQRKQNLFVALSMSNHNQINNQQTNSQQSSQQQNQQNSTLLPISPLTNHFYTSTLDPIDSVVNDFSNTLDDIHLNDNLRLVPALDRDFDSASPTNVTNSISAGLASAGILGSSAPVNIPGSSNNSLVGQFSPSDSSPLHHLHSGFLSSRYSHQDTLDSSFLSNSHLAQLGSNASKLSNFQNTGANIYDFSLSPGNRGNHHPLAQSPLVNNFSVSPSISSSVAMSEVQRLREEIAGNRNKMATWEERICQARGVCEAWQREAEDANRKANIAEQQRDEAVSQAKALQQEVDLLQGSPYLHGLRRISELRNLSLSTLKSIQAQLRNDLEEVDKVLYLQTATKCMVCEERNRTVTLGPCNHFVLCSTCAPVQKNCPYCQTPIIAHSNTTSGSSLQT